MLVSDLAEADKLAAIDVIGARGDREALSLLTAFRSHDGRRAARTPPAAAIAAIDSTLAIWAAGQNVWYGISLGSVLLLAAIGLAITFGVMGVINMAHGEMVMLGAYTTFVVQEAIRNSCARPVRLVAGHRPAARLPGLGASSGSPSSAASSASSTAGRWRRCSPPGACR